MTLWLARDAAVLVEIMRTCCVLLLAPVFMFVLGSQASSKSEPNSLFASSSHDHLPASVEHSLSPYADHDRVPSSI
ncbi:hypothetical protein DENSPDRAFT_883310 [Dentipellis sp. KUC8613]|nr:hypothetical protein DENSPDRAFT_883310 [Dentipellis sp. KUC8613]